MSFLDYKDKILCASKYFSVSEMNRIYDLGIRHFGENYAQDLLKKKSELSHSDIKWHLIGHLQTNKVKMIINEIDYLDSLDSIKLAIEIQKHRKNPLNCLIQINLAEESQKSGILLKDLDYFYQEIKKYDKINLIGFMTIGVHDDAEKTAEIFQKLAELKDQYGLHMLSMGMSNDYQLALQYGSDMLRIGSLFKEVI
ncbi:YggS family pyridoxal phosphate-dependent enzyme [Acholeplasma equirhinis]|uniref:YggS family pyridoxal phosphate-dependent enzyme n=1 Tax=Acholeplasma equirhinis TaxID=555393 RepID=UPI00197AC69B|nr:YggS family pyridoxal phosphate-dependent enzyme [Acholeplasma equirhinis]MBN3490387.1 YggS family pyridoxal phosphate-dependent enzyme [Acholeplasma equirhinis]